VVGNVGHKRIEGRLGAIAKMQPHTMLIMSVDLGADVVGFRLVAPAYAKHDLNLTIIVQCDAAGIDVNIVPVYPRIGSPH
jgi:hypothetical protein